MLEVSELEVSFGKIDVLMGVSFGVARREIVALLGPNGSGKSTTLRAIAGVVPCKRGTILCEGADISRMSVTQRVQNGISLVLQGRRLFPRMTVEENLLLGAAVRQDNEAIREDLRLWVDYFPVLARIKRRLAGELSGGEQQIVAVARGLMSRPKILLLDEPSLGVAPLVLLQMIEELRRIRESHGITIVIVEQNVDVALDVADRVLALRNGRILLDAPAEQVRDRAALAEVYFGDDGSW